LIKSRWEHVLLVCGSVWNLKDSEFRRNLIEFNDRKENLQDFRHRTSDINRIEELFIQEYYSERVGGKESSLYDRFFENRPTLSFDEILKRGLDKIKGHHNNPAIIQLLD
jgi:exonuclease I